MQKTALVASLLRPSLNINTDVRAFCQAFICFQQRNCCTARYTTVWVVTSKERQQKPPALSAARLIGCEGRAADAAAAVVGTHDVYFFLPFFRFVIKVCRQRCFAQDNNITQQRAW